MSKKWAQKVHPEKGKMHDILNIPQGEDITTHYHSGEALAKALKSKVGKEKASHMLAFAGNVHSGSDIFDSARKALSNMNETEEERFRIEIRNILEAQLKETDLVAKNKQSWEEQKKELHKEIGDLLKDLEADEYSKGVEEIEKVISGLQKWKKEINKNI